MNKDTFVVKTYDGEVADRLQEPFKELYEAIYREDKKEAETLLLHILTAILKRYPIEPTGSDLPRKGDLHALELLLADFDMDYADYLSEVKGIKSSDLWSETSSLPLKFVEKPVELNKLIRGIYTYIQGKENKYSYATLVTVLEEYKKDRDINGLH
jgi:hypothetical protein